MSVPSATRVPSPLCTRGSLTTIRKFSFKPCKVRCTADGTGVVVAQHCRALFRCQHGHPSFNCNAHYCSHLATNCSCPCPDRQEYAADAYASSRRLVNQSMLEELTASTRPEAFQAALALTQPLFSSNCEAGYLDLGSNVGERMMQLFEPLLHPGVARPGQRWFGEHLDQRNVSRAHACAVGFEPNPVHRATLQRMMWKLSALGRTARVIEAAIGANNTVQSFYSDGAHASKANYCMHDVMLKVTTSPPHALPLTLSRASKLLIDE